MSTRSKIAILVLATMLAAGAAQAAPADDGVVSAKVQIGDLNLANRAGAQVALNRVERSARAMCGNLVAGPSLSVNTPYQACVNAAIDSTVAHIGAPMVTALREGRRASSFANR